MTEIWERYPKETNLAYQAFICYRDQGMTRSIEKVRNLIMDQSGSPRYKTTRNFYLWSSKYDWVKRARAWDDHIDELRIREIERDIAKERKAAREAHRSIAKAMQKVVLEKLIPNRERPNETLSPNKISTRDLPTWVKIATELDRISLDMPTTMISMAPRKAEEKYAEAGWIDGFTKLAIEFGLLPDGGPTQGNRKHTQAEDEPLYPDNTNP